MMEEEGGEKIFWKLFYKKERKENTNCDFKKEMVYIIKKTGSLMVQDDLYDTDEIKEFIEENKKIDDINTEIYSTVFGEFNSPKDKEERVFIEKLKIDVKSAEENLNEWKDFYFNQVQSIKNQYNQTYSERFIKYFFYSDLNREFNFITEDGIFDHSKFLKILIYSGYIDAPHYLKEKSRISFFDNERLIMV